MQYKFTFKKDACSRGKASIGEGLPKTRIKYNKEVGYLQGQLLDNLKEVWKVYIKVNQDDKNDNCSWKWEEIQGKFESEPDARIFVKDNALYLYNILADDLQDK